MQKVIVIDSPEIGWPSQVKIILNGTECLCSQNPYSSNLIYFKTINRNGNGNHNHKADWEDIKLIAEYVILGK